MLACTGSGVGVALVDTRIDLAHADLKPVTAGNSRGNSSSICSHPHEEPYRPTVRSARGPDRSPITRAQALEIRRRERLSLAGRPRRRRSAPLDAIADLVGCVDGLPAHLSKREKACLRTTGYGQERSRATQRIHQWAGRLARAANADLGWDDHRKLIRAARDPCECHESLQPPTGRVVAREAPHRKRATIKPCLTESRSIRRS